MGEKQFEKQWPSHQKPQGTEGGGTTIFKFWMERTAPSGGYISVYRKYVFINAEKSRFFKWKKMKTISLTIVASGELWGKPVQEVIFEERKEIIIERRMRGGEGRK